MSLCTEAGQGQERFPAHFKVLCDETGSSKVIQDNLAILRSLNPVPLAESLLPCKESYSRVLETKMWTSLGAIIDLHIHSLLPGLTPVWLVTQCLILDVLGTILKTQKWSGQM